MPEHVKLEEIEAYNVERRNAEREGRPCKYHDPREVYASDPNRDSYLVELSEEELAAATPAADEPAPDTAVVNQSVYLADPGQELAEAAALEGADTSSTHQQAQETPNPEFAGTGPADDVNQDGIPDSEQQPETTPETAAPETGTQVPDLTSPVIPSAEPAATTEGASNTEVPTTEAVPGEADRSQHSDNPPTSPNWPS